MDRPLVRGHQDPELDQLRAPQRLLTDGITHRRTKGGGRFGSDGLQAAVSAASDTSAAATTMAIQRAVTDCWREPMEDDATVVVLAIN